MLVESILGIVGCMKDNAMAGLTDKLRYANGIVGDVADLDMPYLKSLGPVKVVTSEEIFGY